MTTKDKLGIVALIIVLAAGFYLWKDGKLVQATNFEECVALGNPVMESYPRQCRSGYQTFTEEVKDIITSADNAIPGSIHNLPVPEAVAKVRALVAERTNTPVGEVIIQTALEKEWSDGCLGLGRADEGCIQMITPGYQIIAEARGTNYIYRTNLDGSEIRADMTEQGTAGFLCHGDAKICPDGTSVGRSGPNCQFTACPGN
jgi:hypothetical protein